MKQLRDFVENPDLDAMEETDSGDLLRDVRDRRAEQVVAEFKRSRPDYLAMDRNFENMAITLAFNPLPESERNAEPGELADLLIERGYWTVPKLIAVYDALDREGLLDRPLGEP